MRLTKRSVCVAALAALAFFTGLVPIAWGRSDPPPALEVLAFAELSPEARQTIRLIRAGGPFPHERDGVVFGNFERLLPVRSRGYYREYTVPTPGLAHRGARRIVAGRGGELYYTGDHYRSFRRIRE